MLRFVNVSALGLSILIVGGGHNALAAGPRVTQRPAAVHKAAPPVEAAAMAPEPESTRAPLAASQTKHELVHLSFNWGRASLHRGPIDLSLGAFGQNAPQIFTGSATALEEARSFQHFMTSAVIVQTAAAAALVADLVYIIARAKQDSNLTATDLGVTWGLLGGGVVLSVIGRGLYDTAFSHLGRAIVAENESTVDRILGVEAQASLYVAPQQGGLSAGAVVRW